MEQKIRLPIEGMSLVIEQLEDIDFESVMSQNIVLMKISKIFDDIGSIKKCFDNEEPNVKVIKVKSSDINKEAMLKEYDNATTKERKDLSKKYGFNSYATYQNKMSVIRISLRPSISIPEKWQNFLKEYENAKTSNQRKAIGKRYDLHTLSSIYNKVYNIRNNKLKNSTKKQSSRDYALKVGKYMREFSLTRAQANEKIRNEKVKNNARTKN